MKKQQPFDSVGAMVFASVIFWGLFVTALAWSVMRYNYAKIPHDITVADSIEAIIVMGIAISAVPFMLASYCTYRTIELVADAKVRVK